MTDYFYLFGFAYLILLARKIYIYTIPVNKDDVLTLDGNTTINDLLDVKQKSDIQPKRPIFFTILDLCCFFWLIIGYMNNQNDKNLFIFLFSIIVLYWLFVISMIIYSVITVVFGSKAKIYNNQNEKSKKPIELTKTLVVTEIVIVICILIKHYFDI